MILMKNLAKKIKICQIVRTNMRALNRTWKCLKKFTTTVFNLKNTLEIEPNIILSNEKQSPEDNQSSFLN